MEKKSTAMVASNPPRPRKAAKSVAKPAGLSAAARQEIRRLKAQLAAAQSMIADLRANADTDFLLEILNRRGFQRELTRSIAYIKRYQATGALIMLDVDRLKPVNDTYGHAAGDAALKAVVAALSRHVRASDLIGRLGGDEFALLLWNLTERDALTKAEALEAAVDQLRIAFEGHTITVGISAGVAILGPDSDVASALAQADLAMYARKAERKNAHGLAAVTR